MSVPGTSYGGPQSTATALSTPLELDSGTVFNFSSPGSSGDTYEDAETSNPTAGATAGTTPIPQVTAGSSTTPVNLSSLLPLLLLAGFGVAAYFLFSSQMKQPPSIVLNAHRKAASKQAAAPVVVNPKGRQPIVSTTGTGLNATHTPSVPATRIVSRNARQPN